MASDGEVNIAALRRCLLMPIDAPGIKPLCQIQLSANVTCIVPAVLRLASKQTSPHRPKELPLSQPIPPERLIEKHCKYTPENQE